MTARHLLVVRATNSSAAEVAHHVRQGVRPFGPGRAASLFERSGRWRLVDTRLLGGFVRAEVQVYEPAGPGRD